MQLSNAELGQVLVKQSYLSQEEYKQVLAEAEERRIDLRTVLFEKRLLTSELLENALAEYYKLPFFDLQNKPPARELINVVPEEFARSYSAIVCIAARIITDRETPSAGTPTRSRYPRPRSSR